METILQHNMLGQPMEWGVQTRLRENKKYGKANYATMYVCILYMYILFIYSMLHYIM